MLKKSKRKTNTSKELPGLETYNISDMKKRKIKYIDKISLAEFEKQIIVSKSKNNNLALELKNKDWSNFLVGISKRKVITKKFKNTKMGISIFPMPNGRGGWLVLNPSSANKRPVMIPTNKGIIFDEFDVNEEKLWFKEKMMRLRGQMGVRCHSILEFGNGHVICAGRCDANKNCTEVLYIVLPMPHHIFTPSFPHASSASIVLKATCICK